MANETLGASFSIDVTNLKAGLAQANRLIKESESEFRAAAAGMDDWTQSEEGLTARINTLNSTTEIQRKKVAALQSEYDRLVTNGLDPASREAVELRTKINNETTALNKNEAELIKQKKALEDLGDGADDAGGSLEGLKAAGGVAVGAIAAVGAACVAAVGAFLGLAESTREARNNMAKVETAFQSAELSAESAADTMTTLYGIMGDEGAASEAAQQLAKISKDEEDLAANTRILTGVMAEYGASIPTEGLAEGMAATAAMGEVQGVLADALEWQGVNLDDYNAKLATMATEEERAAYIQSTLTDIYGESADAYRENNAEIIKAQEAQARLNNVINELGAIAEPIMTSIKTLAADLLEDITPFVSLLGEGLTGALNGTEGAADTFAEGLTGIVTTLSESIVSMLPTVIDTVVAIVPQLLTALLEQLPTILTTLIDMVTQIINGLSAMLPTIIAAIMEVLPQLINSLIAAIPQLLQAAITLLLAIVDALPVIIAELIKALPTVINTIVTVLINSIPILIDGAIQLLMAIVDALPVIIDAMIEALPSLISAMITGLIGAIPKLLDGAIKLFMAIVDAIPQITMTLIGKMPEIIKAIVKGLTDGISNVKEVGKDIIKGLWEGIKDMGSWIGEKIKGFGESVLGGLKDFFGIKSPSKLMADVVGKNIALGIGKGFEDNIDNVNDEITDAIDFDDPNYPNNPSRRGIKGGGVTVYQTNNYKQAYTSRKEKYKAKQELYAAARLMKAGAI